jgi:hypothetical protein
MSEDRKFSPAERQQFEAAPAEVPPVSNALVRLLFSEMVRRQISYQTMDRKSGVSFWTMRKWRRGIEPTDDKLAAALAVVGYKIVRTAVPIGREAD